VSDEFPTVVASADVVSHEQRSKAIPKIVDEILLRL